MSAGELFEQCGDGRRSRLAVARAHELGEEVLSYGDSTSGIGIVPHSVEDTRRLVRRVVGPLIRYDADTGSDLLRSVRVFLDNDGAWQRTADTLSTHRQTLVYRLRKVEQLTGLKPTSTEGASL